MARPSKNQLAERKREKQDARRAASLDLLYTKMESYCYAEAQDEFLVRCEKCGQEQLSGNTVCIICRGSVAVFSSAIESFQDDQPLPYESGALRTITS